MIGARVEKYPKASVEKSARRRRKIARVWMMNKFPRSNVDEQRAMNEKWFRSVVVKRVWRRSENAFDDVEK